MDYDTLELPPVLKIVEAYSSGKLAGPQTKAAIAAEIGVQIRDITKPLIVLEFVRRYNNSDGTATYSPPRGGNSRIKWPDRYILVCQALRDGHNLMQLNRCINTFGLDHLKQGLAKVKQDLKDGKVPDGLTTVVRKISNESSARTAKAAAELITVAELAEALRESPNLSTKEGLLMRVRGLLKAAVRKGHWTDRSTTEAEVKE